MIRPLVERFCFYRHFQQFVIVTTGLNMVAKAGDLLRTNQLHPSSWVTL